MSLHITQIGKHKFACGLFWQALSRPRELVREAKDLARKIDSDLMVLRIDHTAAQAGFAHTRDGARKGIYSLAAVVSKTLAVEGAVYDGDRQPVHNWLGAFRLPDGVWAYFAVRDASFLPNGDFAGTREEVLDRLHSDYGLGGWNAVIGDEELADQGFHNFNARGIESLIPQKKDGRIKVHAWWGLRPVDNRPSWKLAAGTALALAISAGGLAYWKHYQRQQEDLRREAAIEAARREMQGRAAPADLPPPWVGKPLAADMVRACAARLDHLTPGGWLLDSYECTPGQVSYGWSRGNSSVAFLLEQVPAAQVEAGGDRARLVQPLQPAPGPDEALLEFRQLMPQMLSRLQLMQLAFRMTPLAPPPPAPGGAPLRPPYWQGYGFSIKAGAMRPAAIGELLNRPGVRVERLAWKDGQWTIEGVMYGK